MTQAAFSALGDLYLFKLTRKLVSLRAAYTSLLLTALSAYSLYTSVRTFSNTLEASLTTVALYYWPLLIAGPDYVRPDDQECTRCDPAARRYASERRSTRLSLLLAALAFVVRPTNALIWLFLLLRWIPLRMKRSSTASQAIESVLTIGFMLLDAVIIGWVAWSCAALNTRLTQLLGTTARSCSR